MAKRSWLELKPEEAKSIGLPHPDIQGPLTSFGEECLWPWEPEQMQGPIGQYHCSYCGEMVMAGLRHLDYREVHWGPGDGGDNATTSSQVDDLIDLD